MEIRRKLIEFVFPENGVTAVAEMLADYAPRTCTAIWECLSVPARGYAFHSSWAGSEIAFDLPKENRIFDPLSVPAFPTRFGGENLTWIPSAGSVTWTYFPPYYRHSLPEESWDIAVTYGTSYQPGSMLLGATGFIPRNLFAVIIDNLAGFSIVCEKARSQGKKELVIRRCAGPVKDS